jgi:hypothetical protein
MIGPIICRQHKARQEHVVCRNQIVGATQNFGHGIAFFDSNQNDVSC